jgi:hypothetical protein
MEPAASGAFDFPKAREAALEIKLTIGIAIF